MWEAFLDTLQAITAWIVTGLLAAMACWVGWVTKMVVANRTRITVIEENIKSLPARTDEIKATLRDMRADNLDARDEAAVAREKIYGKIENLRLELKEDIKDAKQDIKDVTTQQIKAGMAEARDRPDF